MGRELPKDRMKKKDPTYAKGDSAKVDTVMDITNNPAKKKVPKRTIPGLFSKMRSAGGGVGI